MSRTENEGAENTPPENISLQGSMRSMLKAVSEMKDEIKRELVDFMTPLGDDESEIEYEDEEFNKGIVTSMDGYIGVATTTTPTSQELES